MAEQAKCAHLNVNYQPLKNGDGTCSDRWLCWSCGHDFWPKHWLFPAPWMRETETAMDRASAPEMLNVCAAELRKLGEHLDASEARILSKMGALATNELLDYAHRANGHDFSRL